MPTAAGKLCHAGFSVAWSPFLERRLVATSGAHFGIAGEGSVEVFDIHDSKLEPVAAMRTAAGQFDAAWSEAHPEQLATGGADGRIRLFDLRARSGLPVALWCHSEAAVVNGVSWSPAERTSLCAAGGDGRLTVWHVGRDDPVVSLDARQSSSAVGEEAGEPPRDLWAARWHPTTGPVLADAGVTGCVTVWDFRSPVRAPAAATPPGAELLDLSWCPFRPSVVAAASTAGVIDVWDLRRAASPVATLSGHAMAVLGVAFSPWAADDLLSASYDTRTCLWDAQPAAAEPLTRAWDHHSEFARGVAWSPLRRGLAATVGWDGVVAAIEAGDA